MTGPAARRRPVVWVLVHDLGRTGAPICLARLLGWTAMQPGAPEVHLIAGRDGPLANEVRPAVASLTVLEPEVGRSHVATVSIAAAQLGAAAAGAAVRDRAAQLRVRSLPRPDVVVVHGAGAWPLLHSIERRIGTARVVLHLHELALGIERSIPVDQRDEAWSRPDLVAAVCEPDAATAALLGARARDLVELPGCVDAAAVPPIRTDEVGARRRTARSEVVAVGEAGWRKGTDRFVALAHELGRRRPEVGARWIGTPAAPGWELAVEAALPVAWVGPRALPWAEVGDAVVVVASREDPLPLVALEAALRRLPVVAAATGGLPALLADGRGWCVDGDDLRALAAATLEALGPEPAEHAERGAHDAAGEGDEGDRRAAALDAHVRRHHDVAVVGPAWLAVVLDR